MTNARNVIKNLVNARNLVQLVVKSHVYVVTTVILILVSVNVAIGVESEFNNVLASHVRNVVI